MINVFGVMPVRNRAELTLACLSNLAALRPAPCVSLRIILVDDGSTDGTSDKVRERFPDTMILQGDGSLYWGGAIHLGTQESLRLGADAVWWLNDDLEVNPDCLLALTSAWRQIGAAVFCATVYTPEGKAIYGGQCQRSFFRFRVVDPRVAGRSLVDVDAMNGNCVLIPRCILENTPLSDPRIFVHNGGDMDFTMRARRAGYRLFAVRDAHCSGSPNLDKYAWQGPGLGMVERWRLALSKKGSLYFPMWWRFCRRYGGACWVLYCAKPYVLMAFRSVWFAIRGNREGAGR